MLNISSLKQKNVQKVQGSQKKQNFYTIIVKLFYYRSYFDKSAFRSVKMKTTDNFHGWKLSVLCNFKMQTGRFFHVQFISNIIQLYCEHFPISIKG